MPQRQYRRLASRSPNRTWTGITSTAATAVAAGTKVLAGSFVLSNPGIDETILRTVGVIGIASDQTAASELQLGAFGFLVVTDLAVAAGAASIPGPVTDISDDGWFMFVPFVQELRFLSGSGFAPNAVRLYHFDSKAKRKLPDGSSVAVMVENAHATHGFQLFFSLRMLTMVTGT